MNAIKTIQSVLPVRATSESYWDMIDFTDDCDMFAPIESIVAPDLRSDELATYIAPCGRMV